MNSPAFLKVDKAKFYEFVVRHDDQRFEYEGGYIVQQMTGGTLAHAKIARRLGALIEQQIDPGIWDVTQDRGVDTGGSVRYPDVVVEPSGADLKSLSTMVPALIVEVLSPSSTSRDLQRKPLEYMSVASLAAYVVASQDAPALLAWVRGEHGAFPPEPCEYVGCDAILAIPALGLKLALAEVFEGLEFGQGPLS